jgi:biopolymer transport protein ExbB
MGSEHMNLGWFEIIREGGFIMIPLLLCSVLVWAIVIERTWGLRRFSRETGLLTFKAQKLLKENRLDEARGLFESAEKHIAAPLLTLIGPTLPTKSLSSSDENLLGALERRLVETQQWLRKFLWILGTISSMSPYIGLLGTVVGIIRSFESMSTTGKGGFSVVAAGLSEALIATAAGIFVAIMSTLFYNYFQVKVGEQASKFRHQIFDLADILKEKSDVSKS